MNLISIKIQLQRQGDFTEIFFEKVLEGGKISFIKHTFFIDLESTAHYKTEFVAVVFTLQH